MVWFLLLSLPSPPFLERTSSFYDAIIASTNGGKEGRRRRRTNNIKTSPKPIEFLLVRLREEFVELWRDLDASVCVRLLGEAVQLISTICKVSASRVCSAEDTLSESSSLRGQVDFNE